MVLLKIEVTPISVRKNGRVVYLYNTALIRKVMFVSQKRLNLGCDLVVTLNVREQGISTNTRSILKDRISSISLPAVRPDIDIKRDSQMMKLLCMIFIT